MRIFADENIPRTTVKHLREAGHDVRDFRGTEEQGVEDPDLFAAAQTDRRVLITTDRGFTEFRTISHHGILIVRLRQPNRQKIHRAVMLAIERFLNKNGAIFWWLCEIRRSAFLGPVVR